MALSNNWLHFLVLRWVSLCGFLFGFQGGVEWCCLFLESSGGWPRQIIQEDSFSHVSSSLSSLCPQNVSSLETSHHSHTRHLDLNRHSIPWPDTVFCPHCFSQSTHEACLGSKGWTRKLTLVLKMGVSWSHSHYQTEFCRHLLEMQSYSLNG